MLKMKVLTGNPVEINFTGSITKSIFCEQNNEKYYFGFSDGSMVAVTKYNTLDILRIGTSGISLSSDKTEITMTDNIKGFVYGHNFVIQGL